MQNTVRYLKVKSKSLAAEARIIRMEEKRSTGDLRNGLADHRRGVVRYEARHTNLSYAFLRGTPYKKLEAKYKVQPNWDKVKKMVDKYGAYWTVGEENFQDFAMRKHMQTEAFKTWRE